MVMARISLRVPSSFHGQEVTYSTLALIFGTSPVKSTQGLSLSSSAWSTLGSSKRIVKFSGSCANATISPCFGLSSRRAYGHLGSSGAVPSVRVDLVHCQADNNAIRQGRTSR